MTVTNVEKDPVTLTMTITSRFDAPPEQVWQVWADPRKLERWWGPPTYPATVTDHDLSPGGRVGYFMTGPEGEKHRGLWHVLAVDPPHRLEFEDVFADSDGNPDPALPVNTTTVDIGPEGGAGGGTLMVIRSVFPTLDAMQQLVEMGMEEGVTAALGQIEALLV